MVKTTKGRSLLLKWVLRESLAVLAIVAFSRKTASAAMRFGLDV
tara:strand:- start:224 stop:355 length:132 start_codon:yes stop_codon:yes gene_type:complete